MGYNGDSSTAHTDGDGAQKITSDRTDRDGRGGLQSRGEFLTDRTSATWRGGYTADTDGVLDMAGAGRVSFPLDYKRGILTDWLVMG